MGCNCGAGRRQTAAVQWEVVYPDGRKVRKHTELGAKLAARAVPGATYRKVGG